MVFLFLVVVAAASLRISPPRVPAPRIPAPRVPAPRVPAPRIPAPRVPAPRIPAPQVYGPYTPRYVGKPYQATTQPRQAPAQTSSKLLVVQNGTVTLGKIHRLSK